MTGPDRAVPRENGWWHFTGGQWVPVTEAEARELEDGGQGLDLVYVEVVDEEVPLW
jgi:hypothetical protein